MIIIIAGDLEDELGKYQSGTWIRNPPHSQQDNNSNDNDNDKDNGNNNSNKDKNKNSRNSSQQLVLRSTKGGCILWRKTDHLRLINPTLADIQQKGQQQQHQ